jgi:GTP-binding protein
MFVDRVRIEVRGGDGGAGVASFRRVKGRPRGKPDGGSGGSGGSVIAVADDSTATLLRYSRRPHWRADDGTHGEGDLRHGAKGEDLVLPVPLGTVVGEESGTVIADLVEVGQRIKLVDGGRGGRGNAAFVSPQRKAPTFSEQGEYGESAWVTLEMKVLADAALVGFPNAGKSTLISRVSSARPKIADYPFTTLTPHLGVVTIDGREFAVADVPGLIEGAADGKGLGHEFLRHVERARVLVILLDPTPLQDMSYADQLDVLLRELDAHSPDLANRPRVVVVNKVDALSDTDEITAWVAQAGQDVHLVSAVTGEGIETLMHAVADAVAQHEREAPDREGFVLHRPVVAGYRVARAGDGWVVAGRAAERAINLADLTVPEAADFVAARLRRIGVEDALREAGALPGDDVQIGDITFSFNPDVDDVAPQDNAGEETAP